MDWPDKSEREAFEIRGFIEAYTRLAEPREFEVMSKHDQPDGGKAGCAGPDYFVRDKASGQEYGVELTSVYLDDQSVPKAHKPDGEGLVCVPYDKKVIEKYGERLVAAVVDKVCKARCHYDRSRPLILAIYLNEYITLHMRKSHLEELTRRYRGLFDAMTPFSEVVFWDLPDGEVFRVRPN
jgi:hypothetical protein